MTTAVTKPSAAAQEGTEKRKTAVFLPLRDVMRILQLAGSGLGVPGDVGRLCAEILRLRAKGRVQRREIEALTRERDALAQLVLAYAPKPTEDPR
jgi:hypothetical protein